jgi:Protein of unknown function (DUF4446)
VVLLGVLVLVVILLVGGGLAVLAYLARRRSAGRGDVDALPADVVGLRQEVAALRAEAKGALRHVGLIRYDAFAGSGPSVGGRQSWSLALLDDDGNGVVLTAIHGRSEARSYAKSVADWRSELPMSPEEQDAVASAKP